MAVKSTKVQSTMSIKFKTGVDAKGKDTTKSHKFSNVKVAAADEDVFAVGTAIGSLLKYQLVDVLRDDQSSIENE